MGSMNREIKKISEDIKTNTFKQFYLFYGEEKYMILQMKDQLKRALISEDDTMNYSYFEGKKVDPTEIWRFCLARAIIPVLSEPVFRLTLIHFDFA